MVVGFHRGPQLDEEGGVFSNSLVDPGSTRWVDRGCVGAERHPLGVAKGASDLEIRRRSSFLGIRLRL